MGLDTDEERAHFAAAVQRAFAEEARVQQGVREEGALTGLVMAATMTPGFDSAAIADSGFSRCGPWGSTRRRTRWHARGGVLGCARASYSAPRMSSLSWSPARGGSRALIASCPWGSRTRGSSSAKMAQNAKATSAGPQAGLACKPRMITCALG